MNRCERPGRRFVLLSLAALLCSAVMAQPQVARNFPQNALRGEVLVQNAHEALINGQPVRFAPGLRLRGQDNLMLVSGVLIDQKFIGHYTLDGYGLVTQLWVLRDDELANKLWPRTPEESAAWSFDPAAQVWSKP
jgi:hypothetical protein